MAVILDQHGKPWRDSDTYNANPDRWDRDLLSGQMGTTAVPHVLTFSSIMGSAWRAYWHGRQDEAYRESRPDALAMRRDPALMGLYNERRMAVSSLKWHVEGHDEKNPAEVELKDQVEAAVRRTPYLRKFLLSALEAVWYGRAANKVRLRPREQWQTVRGRPTCTVAEWEPVNGDKLGYRWDGTPYVLVHAAWADRIPGAETFPTTMGRGLLLKGPWRERFVVHKHDVIDGDFFDPESAGAVHGVGLRHWLYWFWWMKQEYMEWIATYLERVGLGITLWLYDASNPENLSKVQAAAKEAGRRTNLFVPQWPDSRGGAPVGGVERVETPVSGVEALRTLVDKLDEVMERFVVGQSMSGGSDNESGLGGSGRAAFARDTKAQITEHDALNLAESLTGSAEEPGLVWLIQSRSRPDMPPERVPLRFAFDVESPESKEKLDGAKTLFDMRVKIKADEARAAAGFSKPTDDDEVVEQPDEQQAGPQQEQREDPRLAAQAQQQELQAEMQRHAAELRQKQAEHEQALRHEEEKHAHGMRREQTRTAFEAQQAEQKARLAQQQAAWKARQQRAQWEQRQRQAQWQQQQRQAQAQAQQQTQPAQPQQAQAQPYGRGHWLDPLRYGAEWDEGAVKRDTKGRFAEQDGWKVSRDEYAAANAPDLPPIEDDGDLYSAGEMLREAVMDVAGGPKDACILAAVTFKRLYPEAELWYGKYLGEPHLLAKMGDFFLDVTADQFHPTEDEVKVFTKEEMEREYQHFRKEEPAEVGYWMGWGDADRTAPLFAEALREKALELERNRHSVLVMNALRAGERLPSAVAKEYPRLVKEYAKYRRSGAPWRYDREPFDEAKIARDEGGRFAKMSAPVKRIARRLWAAATRRTPRTRKRLKQLAHLAHAGERFAMLGFSKGKQAVEAVARAKGSSPETARRAAKIVAVVDQAVAWTTTLPLVTALTGSVSAGKAASFLPLGSLCYLAASTASDPEAVLIAAQEAWRAEKPEQRPAARVEVEGLPERFSREWDEGAVKRDEEGKFAEQAGGSIMPTGEPQGQSVGSAGMGHANLANWTIEDSGRGVDPADLSAPVDGYRLQDGAKEMPRESSSHWTGDEDNTMGGSSAYANASNVIGDMLFGAEESVTGENYSGNIEAAGGHPQLWLLASDYQAEDAPGAEVVIPEARPAGKFSKRQVWEALREVIGQDFPEALGYAEPSQEFDDEFAWADYADDAVELLRRRLREALGHAQA